MPNSLLAALRFPLAAGSVALLTLLAVPPAATAQSGVPDHDLQTRIAAVDTYLRSRPGVTGYVVRDRATGAYYASPAANTRIWTSSTIKLAVAADLLRRDRAGQVRLAAGDRELIGQMLRASDNAATDVLWRKFAGADRLDFQRGFQALGMRDLAPQRGFHPEFEPYWGFEKATAADFDRLLDYVLTRAHPADQAYLTAQLQQVDSRQHWGVWGAGPQAGAKNGWSDEDNGWVVSSVGFTGQGGPRHTLAIMNSLDGKGDFAAGRDTVTHVARLLLTGR